MAAAKNKGDYLPAHNFKIEIDGVISGGFQEVTGHSSSDTHFVEEIEFVVERVERG